MELELIEVPVDFNKDYISFRLPLDFAKYLKVSPKGKYQTVFVVPTSGLLQICGQRPQTTIPIEIENPS